MTLTVTLIVILNMAEIPSTSSGLFNFDFVTSKRGGRVLLLASHQYYQKKEYKNRSTYWRCVKWPKCHGTLTIMEKQSQMIKSTVHSCPASYAQNEVKRVISRRLFHPYIVKL